MSEDYFPTIFMYYESIVISMQVMAEGADTKDEFYELALNTLQELGVSNPEVGKSGSFNVTPGQRDIKRVTVTESTRPFHRVANQFPLDSHERLILSGPRVTANYGGPICNILSCNVLTLLGRECSYTKTTWTPPDISSQAIPDKVDNATVYLNPFNARIEGEVTFDMSNSSEPGEKHTQTKYKCKEDGDVNTSVLENSAILDGDNAGDWYDDQVDELIDSVNTSYNSVEPNYHVEATTSFKKKGALSVLKSLLNAWLSGTMTSRAQTTLTVKYDWRGTTNTKQFDVDTVVAIPVSNLNYSW